MKEGRKHGYLEKTPDDELHKNAIYKSLRIQSPTETRTCIETSGGRRSFGKQKC